MLSTTAEYALRIMVVLSASESRPITSERIATSSGVPTDYSVKVLQMLARAQLVKAQRGRGGGFRLACDPQRTTLLDVVNAIDPIERLAPCPVGSPPAARRLCALHGALDAALAQMEHALAGTTLHRVLHGSTRPALCTGIPLAAHAERPAPAPVRSAAAG